MAIHLHRCERTDGLLTGLAEVLAPAPADPFTPDLVAVPTRGIERFLAQGLALRLGAGEAANGVALRLGAGEAAHEVRADGVCANVRFPSPVDLLELVVAGPRSPGTAPVPVDPWRPERAVWPLLGAIDASAGEDWCHPLAWHLGLAEPAATRGAGPREELPRIDRRFAVASRLAALFHSYASQRPSLVLEWAAGDDTDGTGQPLPGDLLWQPELWRRLRARIGVPSPAERLAAACSAMRADPAAVDLPARLSVFGPSRLPADQLAVLAALAEHREVHLWLADASPALWAALGSGPSGTTAGVPPRRASDDSGVHVRHPLLRSLGRDARELRIRLREVVGPGATDVHTPAGMAGERLLARLQRELRDDVPSGTAGPGGPAGTPIGRADRSLQVHACHGPARQAEVLREVVLGLLEADGTLQPRDILVMCPDLVAMAPLVSAAFSDARPGSRLADLRLRIADRTPEQANEVLSTLDALLTLAPGRMLRSEVVDLVARGPVRARFGLAEEEVARIEQLAIRAGVRWGLDERTRAAHGLAGLATGTWLWGLDRMLLGAALSEDGLPLLDGVLPLDDVQGGDLLRIGRLAEILARVRLFRDGTLGRHPLDHWVALLEGAVTGLMDATGADAWQVPHALAAIAALPWAAAGHESDVDLSLADLRWMLDTVLAGRPTRTNFRSGGLTVCGLVPMRSVPHRVICLVGMDDGTFPRALAPDGDDVLARDPRLGERDPRSEDRQLLLDAIMAATDHLVITYTGADDRTNETRPPCVPLGQLLDTIDAMGPAADGLPGRTQVVLHHPLQPFDPRNHTPGALVPDRPFSHDRESLAAARAAVGPRTEAPPFLTAALSVEPVAEVSLTELVRFLRAPAAAFLRMRLGLPVRADDEDPEESLAIELDGLARWGIGQRSMDLLAQGCTSADVVAAERARGVLPPGHLAGPVLAEVGSKAEALAAEVRAARVGDPRQVPIRADLPSGRRVHGVVDDVHDSSIVRGTYSTVGASQLLAVWPDLLAAATTEPDRPWTARVIGRRGEVLLTAPPPPRPAAILDELLDLVDAGMAAPLPLPAATANAYAAKRLAGYRWSTSVSVARKAWLGQRRDGSVYGEGTDPVHERLLGAGAPLEALLAERPRDGEDWYPNEESRFAVLALRLWQPIMAASGGGR